MKTFFTAILILFSIAVAHCQSSAEEKEVPVVIREISTDKNYGFKERKSIKVGSIKNEYVFIAQLAGPNGEQISATRLGSCCSVKSKNAPFGRAMLDMWEIKYEGLNKPIVIYLNGYDYEEPKCPMGLSFKQP